MQFDYDGSNKWRGRRDKLLGTLHSNPKAKFITRALQFGSEPLFSQVITPSDLIEQINAAKANLSSLHIPVTATDFAYSFRDVCNIPYPLLWHYILILDLSWMLMMEGLECFKLSM